MSVVQRYRCPDLHYGHRASRKLVVAHRPSAIALSIRLRSRRSRGCGIWSYRCGLHGWKLRGSQGWWLSVGGRSGLWCLVVIFDIWVG